MKRCRAMILLLLALLCAAGTAVCDRPAASEWYYTEIGKTRVHRLGSTDYYVDHYTTFLAEANLQYLRAFAESFNAAVDRCRQPVDAYLYFVDSSRSIDLAGDLTGDNPLYTQMKTLFHVKAADCLKIDSADDYCNYFYQTDHHWNYKGSYMGYTQMARMMLGRKEPLLKPLETVTFDITFNGSYARRAGKPLSKEKFAAYRFNLPKVTVFINGKKGVYGHQSAYFSNRYRKDEMFNHYGYFYGGDKGLIQLSAQQSKKQNLLMIGTSYTNAVKNLLAKHYNNIYCVDIRHYDKDMKEPFSLSKSVEEWKIDQVLLVLDVTMLTSGYLLES